MKKEYKVIAILDFICTAIWLVCLIFDIVEKDFSTKFFLHIVLVVLTFINGFFYLKRKPDSEKKDNLDKSDNN